MSRLEIENLSISFKSHEQLRRMQEITVVSNVSLQLESGEVMALIGASGSGKSVLAHALFGILPENAYMTGNIRYDEENITMKQLKNMRGTEFVFIPQSVDALDPLMKVGKQVRFAVPNKCDRVVKQRAAFEKFQLPKSVEKLYPYELSGGMARRVLLSMAQVTDARVLIADEPTPGLDPTIIQAALETFIHFKHMGATVLMITHDVETALKIADKVAVLYEGTVVEIAPVGDFSNRGERLRHPYTKALWQALPQNDFKPIDDQLPVEGTIHSGCVFAPHCPMKTTACLTHEPTMRTLRDGEVRCIHAT